MSIQNYIKTPFLPNKIEQPTNRAEITLLHFNYKYAVSHL